MFIPSFKNISLTKWIQKFKGAGNKPVVSEGIAPVISEALPQRQQLRSQYYYNTLARELETPQSFYNPRTGNTTHYYAPEDSRIVTVTNGNDTILSINKLSSLIPADNSEVSKLNVLV